MFYLHYDVTTVRIWPLECISGIISGRLDFVFFYWPIIIFHLTTFLPLTVIM